MMLAIITNITKANSRQSSLACRIALDVVKSIQFEKNGRKEIHIKNMQE